MILEEMQHVLLDILYVGLRRRDSGGAGVSLHDRFNRVVQPDFVVQVIHTPEFNVVAVHVRDINFGEQKRVRSDAT